MMVSSPKRLAGMATLKAAALVGKVGGGPFVAVGSDDGYVGSSRRDFCQHSEG